MTDVRQHPAYAAGFEDAKALEPLHADAQPEYAAGWRAYWACRDLSPARLDLWDAAGNGSHR